MRIFHRKPVQVSVFLTDAEGKELLSGTVWLKSHRQRSEVVALASGAEDSIRLGDVRLYGIVEHKPERRFAS